MKDMKEFIFIGTIELGEKVCITDPCYEPFDRIVKVKPGQYDCFVTNDNSEIIIRHTNFSPNRFRLGRKIGYAGVDSGQCGFFDSEYYKSEYDAENDSMGEFDNKDSLYGECCEITINTGFSAGILKSKKGFVSRTKYGDGSYPVFAFYTKNRNADYIKIETT